jgi:hypothetical protein
MEANNLLKAYEIEQAQSRGGDRESGEAAVSLKYFQHLTG